MVMRTILKSAGFLFLLAIAIQTEAQKKPSITSQDSAFITQTLIIKDITLRSNFEQNLAIAFYKGKYGIINEKGNWIVEPIFDWNGIRNDGFEIRVVIAQAK
jgi:hypothetical protein